MKIIFFFTQLFLLKQEIETRLKDIYLIYNIIQVPHPGCNTSTPPYTQESLDSESIFDPKSHVLLQFLE